MMALVTKSAVMTEITIPRNSVWAKPLTVPEPLIIRTMAASTVVTLPSMIAERAFS